VPRRKGKRGDPLAGSPFSASPGVPAPISEVEFVGAPRRPELGWLRSVEARYLVSRLHEARHTSRTAISTAIWKGGASIAGAILKRNANRSGWPLTEQPTAISNWCRRSLPPQRYGIPCDTDGRGWGRRRHTLAPSPPCWCQRAKAFSATATRMRANLLAASTARARRPGIDPLRCFAIALYGPHASAPTSMQ
jgi:hypothetical protein